MSKQKKRVLIAVGILISVGFLWFALRGTDFTEIGRALADSDPWLVVPLLAAYGLYYWIKAVRWRLPGRGSTRRRCRSRPARSRAWSPASRGVARQVSWSLLRSRYRT
jgi:hypothetical protein